MRFLRPLLALFLLLPAAGAAQEEEPLTCSERLAGLCDRFREDGRVALREKKGLFLLNPATSGPTILSYEPLQRLIIKGVNHGNAEGRLRTLLEDLKSLLAPRIMRSQGPRSRLARDLPNLRLVFREMDRCRDMAQPFHPYYDNPTATIEVCPWMSHLAPEMFVSVLAHRLGHFVDPCQWRYMGKADEPILPPFPAVRAQDCATNIEDFADEVGAFLTAEYLGSARAKRLDFPKDFDERAAVLFYDALKPGCQSDHNESVETFLVQPGIRRFLGCE